MNILILMVIGYDFMLVFSVAGVGTERYHSQRLSVKAERQGTAPFGIVEAALLRPRQRPSLLLRRQRGS